MNLYKYLMLLLLSQRGEGEGEGEAGGEGGEGSDEGQGDPNASTDGEGGEGGGQGQQGEGQQAETLETLNQKIADIQAQYESLKGQSGATERNLSSERKAAEAAGFKVVRDHEGNAQWVPIGKAQQGESRFTDEHKGNFMTYFPDSKSGEGFLNLLEAWGDDFFGNRISKFDKTLTQRQQFQTIQADSNERMVQLYPQLDPSDKGSFNKPLYDKATEIWERNYRNLPNGELIAANEAAVEMGIAPSTIVKAKKLGFDKGRSRRKIVGDANGDQSGGGAKGFKKLSYPEYQKLPEEGKAKYDKEEVESRKG